MLEIGSILPAAHPVGPTPSVIQFERTKYWGKLRDGPPAFFV